MEIEKLPEVESVKEFHYQKLPQERKQMEKGKISVWAKSFSKGKLKKPNTVAIMFLRNNGKVETMEKESKLGFFNIYGRTYHEDISCIYRMKDGTPLAIIPEWSLIPYGTKQWHDKPMLEKFSELQDHAIKGIRHEELVRIGGEQKKPVNYKALILLGIAAIIAWAFLSGSLT